MPPIAVALDGPDLATVLAWAAAAGPHVSTMKVGLETFLRDGAAVVDDAVRAASGVRDVFLDLKLHDIPNTVAGAARAVAHLGPDYLTVHASGGPRDGGRRGRGAAGHPDHRGDRAHLAVRGRPRAVGLRGPALEAALRLAAAGGRAPERGRSCARRRRWPRSGPAVPGDITPDHAGRAAGDR